MNELINQRKNERTNERTNNEAVSQSVSQSVNQSISQAINQSINSFKEQDKKTRKALPLAAAAICSRRERLQVRRWFFSHRIISNKSIVSR